MVGYQDDRIRGRGQVFRGYAGLRAEHEERDFVIFRLPNGDEVEVFGPSDREHEHLVTSDKGVALYHKLIFENIDKVERGEDPMGVIRDPEANEPMIAFRRERGSRKLLREPAAV